MEDIFYPRTDCRLCRSTHLEVVVPLAPIPIATPNVGLSTAGRNHPIFTEAAPLELVLCKDCGMVQLSCVGNADTQYSNYTYRTASSLGLREHFADYAAWVISMATPQAGELVIEMGSNDGTLLGFFKDRGLAVQGIDPAADIAKSASANGIPTQAAFFTEALAHAIHQEQQPAKIILANNVFANIDDLSDIMRGVHALLADDGVFVMETQYGPDVFDGNLLDTVYHEHLSYFALQPLQRFYAQFGLQIIDVRSVSTKGGSFRVIAQRQGGPRPVQPAVSAWIKEENRKGIFTSAFYARLSTALAEIRGTLAKQVTEVRGRGGKIAGYGVSVGTTALLPQFGLTDAIDFFVDDGIDKAPALIGPDYEIPVRSPEALYSERPEIVVVFAWRYAAPIMKKHQRFLDEGGRFVVPLPEIQIFPDVLAS